jgi:hypothetical protein
MELDGVLVRIVLFGAAWLVQKRCGIVLRLHPGGMLNRYSHVTPDMQRSAADVLDAAFTRVS